MDLRRLAHHNLLMKRTKEAEESPFFVRYVKCRNCNWVSFVMKKYNDTTYSISHCFICGQVPTPTDMQNGLGVK
jgi:hypothetical protein